MPEAPGSPEVEIEDGTWTVAEVKGKMLVIVFEAPAKEIARAVIRKVKK